MVQQQKPSDGILECARYAFKPNQLNYCGPDKNSELAEYLKAGESDGGLRQILQKFETLYPYLKLIARSNKKEDAFDKKISEAYWIGNDFLQNVKMTDLHGHLMDGLQLGKKISSDEREKIREKIPRGANAHHSFHVFNIWKRTGHIESPHTLFTMDECRIGWGKVEAVNANIITVLYKPVIFENNKLAFGPVAAKNVFHELSGRQVKTGDWISFHWSSFCDVISQEELKNLRHWTSLNLELVNYAR